MEKTGDGRTCEIWKADGWVTTGLTDPRKPNPYSKGGKEDPISCRIFKAQKGSVPGVPGSGVKGRWGPKQEEFTENSEILRYPFPRFAAGRLSWMLQSSGGGETKPVAGQPREWVTEQMLHQPGGSIDLCVWSWHLQPSWACFGSQNSAAQTLSSRQEIGGAFSGAPEQGQPQRKDLKIPCHRVPPKWTSQSPYSKAGCQGAPIAQGLLVLDTFF